VLTGYEFQKDPILSSLLYTTQLSKTISMKKKARILVEDSCVLIGVVDDLGILGPDQVYVQIREHTGDKGKKVDLWGSEIPIE
jgi:RNA-dependent RNA polymerase